MDQIGRSVQWHKKLKKKICLAISKNILNFYTKFRECSELQIETKKKIEEYKRSEQDVKIIKRELPRIKFGIDELQQEKEFLRSRLDYALNDLHIIKQLLDMNRCNDISNVLQKYDFDVKIND